MTLSKQIVDEKLADLERQRVFFRDQIVSLAKGDASTEGMISEFEALARIEGKLKAWTEASRQLHKTDAEECIVRIVQDRLLYGADDKWSGRSNDRQRSFHDGYRDAAQEILNAIRYL